MHRVKRAKHNVNQGGPRGKSKGIKTNNKFHFEIGKYVPSTLLALKIAAVFNTGVNDIFTLEDEDWN